MTTSHNSGYFPGNANGLVSGNGDPVVLGTGFSLANGILTSAATATAATKFVRLSNHGHLRWAGGYYFGQGNPGYTFAALYSIPGAFLYARLFFLNTTTANANVGGTIFLGTTARSDYIYPVDASGNPVPSGFSGMQTVGFDQGSSALANAIYTTFHPANGNTITASSTVVPAASGPGGHALGKAWSDWAYTLSVPPQDGGNFRYLLSIIDTPTSLGALTTGYTFNAANNGFNQYSADLGSKMRGSFVQGSASANLVALNGTISAGSANYGVSLAAGVEVIFEQAALTIITVGDSLSDNPHAGQYCGAEAAAAFMVRDSGLPVCCYNMSWFGFDVVSYSQLAITEIETVKEAGVIIIQAQSGNTDGSNVDGSIAGWNELERGCALVLAARATQLGMFVIMVGPCPYLTPASGSTSASSTYVTLVQQQAAKIKAYGYAYLDRDVLWGYGNGSMQADPQWFDTNTRHPTPAALQREGSAIQAIITPFLPPSASSGGATTAMPTSRNYSSDFSSDYT